MRTLYDDVRSRLSRLIFLYGVGPEALGILRVYDLICRQSLDLKPGAQRPEMCRLNRDGTPIQFSLAVARGARPSLAFLGEAGTNFPDSTTRIASGLEVMRSVAGAIGAGPEFGGLESLWNRTSAETTCRAEGGGPGAYWIGVSFAGDRAAMTVYISTQYGSVEQQWERGRTLSSWLPDAEARLKDWRRIETALRGHMTPLGMAVTLARGRPVGSRVYFKAYGLPFGYYLDALPRLSGEASLCSLLDRYLTIMVGAERIYPARSVVCSFEVGPEGRMNAKFELCAHCAWESDAEVARRSLDWLRREGMDTAMYLQLTEILGGERGAAVAGLHAFVGIGMKSGEPCTTFYLNPGPGLGGE